MRTFAISPALAFSLSQPPPPLHSGLMNILAKVLARLGHRSSAASPATPPVPPTAAELNRQWHKDRAKARGGDHPWSAGQQDQGQPGKSWGGIGGGGIFGG